MAGSAAFRAVWAAFLSPAARASSTLRMAVRTSLRRLLLTSVRRAVLRTRFSADLWLGMGCLCPFRFAEGLLEGCAYSLWPRSGSTLVPCFRNSAVLERGFALA